MNGGEKDVLIEQAASAFRERNAEGRILPPPAWWDLAPEEREALYVAQAQNRLIVRALDPAGLSATVRAVLDRLKR